MMGFSGQFRTVFGRGEPKTRTSGLDLVPKHGYNIEGFLRLCPVRFLTGDLGESGLSAGRAIF